MKVHVEGLGYREIAMLAEFMMEVSDRGLDGDVATEFGFNLAYDSAYVETENGETIFADDF